MAVRKLPLGWMNWRSTARVLDWAVPLGFGMVLCLKAPLRTALEFGGDEGYELMKGFLVSLGHPLYREVWNDQPPLHTELLTLLFRLFGPSAWVGRLLSVGFAMVLVGALYRLVSDRSGRMAGLVAVGLLVSSSFFVQLSVSVMIELPAMALALAAVWAGSKYFASKGRRWLIFSGVLFGCALQVKWTAAIFLPALAVEHLARRVGRNRRIDPLPESPHWIETGQGNDAGPLFYEPPGRAGCPQPAGVRCGEDTAPHQSGSEARCLRKQVIQGRLREALVWCGAVLAAFGVIAVVFYRGGTLAVFWVSHFSRATRAAVAPGGYGFRPETLLNDLALLAPAAAGVALIGWKRRSDLLFPVVLLATAFAIHLWHRPYWYYYGLHFAIPLAWVGAVGIVEWFRAIWRLDLGASLATKLRAGIGWLVWSIFVSLVLTLAPEKAWNEWLRLSAAVPAMENQNVAELRKNAAQTHWVFTDRVVYAFWAGLPVPPELAVIPSKRIWSGQISKAQIVECLERYRPEQILLQSDWETKFGLSEYMQAHYQSDSANGLNGLYPRK